MRLIFSNAQLKDLIEVTNKGKQFHIPYGGEKSTPKKTFWLVKDEGTYLMPSVKGLKYPLDRKLIVYAKGKGPGTYQGGGDFCEELPWTDNLQKIFDLGYDFVIDITTNSFSISYMKPKSKV